MGYIALLKKRELEKERLRGEALKEADEFVAALFQENFPKGVLGLNYKPVLQEVVKNTILPGVFQMEPATMINLDRWKKIPKDLQDLLLDTMKEYEYIATMRSLMIEEHEDRVRAKAGGKTIVLPPEEAAKFTKLAYDVTWESILKASPEYGPKLRKAMSKEAVPKGTFPWQ